MFAQKFAQTITLSTLNFIRTTRNIESTEFDWNKLSKRACKVGVWRLTVEAPRQSVDGG